MGKIFLACLLVLLTFGVAQAQTPMPLQANAVWQIAADVSTASDVVETVTLVVDGVSVSVPAARTGDTITVTDRPGLAVGSHTGSIAFCNVVGCGPSTAFAINAMTTPGPPTNLRLSLKQLADAIRAVGSAVDDVAASLGQ